MIVLFWIFFAPSIQLKKEWQEKHKLIDFFITPEQQRLAELDLKEKVYKEIQARFGETNDWLFRKFTLAGGLLAAFLFRLWWPFLSPTATEWTFERRQNQAITLLSDFLQSSPSCAILGLACIVSLFVDIQIRRSSIVINELGVWVADYGATTLVGSVDPHRRSSHFYSWEEFIRDKPPDEKSSGEKSPGGQGMHQSFATAIQIGNLASITGILFIFYHVVFQEICRQGLDWFNRLIYWLVVLVLLAFVTAAHLTSGNFEFVKYDIKKVYDFDLGQLLSRPYPYNDVCY
jgi:hypothetical protein